MSIVRKSLPIRYSVVKGSGSSVTDPLADSEQNVQRIRSWRAVTTMGGALILGVFFATAQHLTNACLDGRDVNSVQISSAWVARINTALAFLVKTSLVVTTGVAFIQRQWFNLRREPLSVNEIDSLTGVLANIFNLADTSTWFRHPLLTLIALVSWTIPIATIITPGSILLDQKPETNVTNVRVPQHDWAGVADSGGSGTAYSMLPCCGAFGQVYAKPETYKIAYASGMTGTSLSLPSNFQNESYHLEFYGPVVQCTSANNTIQEVVRLYQNASSTNPVVATYISWVPGDEDVHGLTIENLESQTPDISLSTFFKSLDQTSPDVSRVYVMAISGRSYNASVTECLLYNATYDMVFNFTYPDQQHTVSSLQVLNQVAATRVIADERGSYDYLVASYAGVMDAFGRLLVGSNTNDQYGTNVTVQTSYNLLSIDWDDADAIRHGLESLFQNITLSFLSVSSFTKNSSEAASIQVSATFWPVKYAYSPWELWLPYGIGIGVAMICLLVGLHAFNQNGGSYQNIFSTYVRATSHHELREHVPVGDICVDPLPQDLGKIQVQLGRH